MANESNPDKRDAPPARAPLSVINHDRDREGLTYVYPVVSRRAGGVSLGINLNPNNACNWQCMYCQVPDLRRGSAPTIDHAQLRRELEGMLEAIVHGTYLQDNAPPQARVFKDIAISGNGEPTTCKTFAQVIDDLDQAVTKFDLSGRIKLTLITNGSLIARPQVLQGLTHFGKMGGEVWYKLDAVTPEARRELNHTDQSLVQVRRHIALAAERCAVRLQRCVVAIDGQAPSEPENAAYVAFVGELLAAKIPLAGITLYGLARPSMQPQAHRLAALPRDHLERMANHLRDLGREFGCELEVEVHD